MRLRLTVAAAFFAAAFSFAAFGNAVWGFAAFEVPDGAGPSVRFDGMWFLDKDSAVSRQGMTEGDAIEFRYICGGLSAGDCIQFGVCLENDGETAPAHFCLDVFDGGQWVACREFDAVSSAVRHPSTCMIIYSMQHAVADTLKARCRVCSPYATDGSLLSAESKENRVSLKSKYYVGAKLLPLGPGDGLEEKSILLIGNSFTYFYGEAFMLQEIAFSQGWKLDVHASLKGGQGFRQHCGLEMTRAMCTLDEPYDFAVFQGMSLEPARYAANPVAYCDVKDALLELCSLVRSGHPDGRLLVEETWAYPVSKGEFKSIEQFRERLERGSAVLSKAAGAGINPVGSAFERARLEAPEIQLLHSDNKHQGLAGAYLKACITWLTISGRTSFNGPVPSCGLPDSDAATLRDIAESVAGER